MVQIVGDVEEGDNLVCELDEGGEKVGMDDVNVH